MIRGAMGELVGLDRGHLHLCVAVWVDGEAEDVGDGEDPGRSA